MEAIKTLMKKKCPVLFAILRRIWIFMHQVKFFLCYTLPKNVGYLKRKFFPSLPSKYSRVKTLKDIHKGKKCFIIATGPSLTIEDLNMLRSGKRDGYITMSLNSIVLSYARTDWRPDYWAMIDWAVSENIFAQMGSSYDLWHNIDPSHILLGGDFGKVYSLPEEVILFPHIAQRFNDRVKFSDNCFERVCEGFTITYSCIQLAVYMGCREIYLLGVDCNYTGSNDHAFGFIVDKNTQQAHEKRADYLAYRMRCAYEAAKEYADSHGIKIYNATRGGKLEVFERITLEDALKA